MEMDMTSITIEGAPDELMRLLALWAVYTAETSEDCISSIEPAIKFIDTFAHAINGLYRREEGGSYLLSDICLASARSRVVAKQLLDILDLPNAA
jgi:hypothetical protein